MTTFAEAVRQGIPASIPDMPPEEPGTSHAPARPQVLDMAILKEAASPN